MKRLITRICLCLVWASVLCWTLPFFAGAEEIASGTCGADAVWSCTSDGVLTISGSGSVTGQPYSQGREKVSQVVIRPGITGIGDYAFMYFQNMTRVTIPDTVTSIGNGAFYACTGLTTISIPQNVTHIGGNAFSGCSKLSKVTIPDGVTSIEDQTFYGCENLTSVTVGDGVERVGAYAFYGCTSLSNVTLGTRINTIGDFAFWGCRSLSNLTIPSATKEIGVGAFSASGLTRITIPKNVARIGDSAFYQCKKLSGVKFTGDAPELGDQIFGNVTATVRYPAENATWTTERMQNYGGSITWADLLETPVATVSNRASDGKPVVRWEPVPGAVKYQVYSATSRSGKYTLLITTSGTKINNISAKTGSTYYYKVRAVDGAGIRSDFSEIKYRTCDLAKPVVTIGNVASTGKIRISWNPVEGASEYAVYRATSRNGTYKLLKTVTGTKLTNTSATAGKTYCYKVRAIHEKTAANSAYSDIKSRTCDLAQPTLTVKRNSSGKPQLTWTKIDGAVGYQVYRATEQDGSYSLLKTTTGTILTNTSAQPGILYYYKVVAVCDPTSGNSASSL